MKFSVCMDNSEWTQKAIEESVHGDDEWQYGARFDHCTVYQHTDGDDIDVYNIVHFVGSVISFLRWKLRCIWEKKPRGCFMGWQHK